MAYLAVLFLSLLMFSCGSTKHSAPDSGLADDGAASDSAEAASGEGGQGGSSLGGAGGQGEGDCAPVQHFKPYQVTSCCNGAPCNGVCTPEGTCDCVGGSGCTKTGVVCCVGDTGRYCQPAINNDVDKTCGVRYQP